MGPSLEGMRPLFDDERDAVRDRFVALLLRTRATPGARPEAVERQRWAALVDAARGYDELPGSAMIVLAPSAAPGHHGRLAIACDPLQPGVAGWVSERLGALGASLDGITLLALDAAYGALLPPLERAGFRVTQRLLIGEVAVGLPRARAAIRVQPESLGVSFEPMQPADVPAQLELARAWFTAHPELTPTGAVPTPEEQAVLDRQYRDRLLTRSSDRPATQFTLWHEGCVAGRMGLLPREGEASLDVVLAPALHGRGLAWSMYAHLLSAIAQRGLPLYAGATSNPAVLHVGERLGRWVRGWQLAHRGLRRISGPLGGHDGSNL